MAEVVGRYDASETEDRGGSAYFSKRDLRNIGIVILVLMALLYPVYKLFVGNSEKFICSKNFNAISEAMGLYMEENNGRFPPAYVSAPNGSPLLLNQGRPFTWNSLLHRYMSESASFRCPSAAEAEVAQVLHPETNKESLGVTYGLYTPYAGFLRDIVPNLSQTAIMAETSNYGARDTFDPLKFQDPEGNPIEQDAFVIGFDNDQFFPNEESMAVTRLALPDTANGRFGAEAGTRHSAGIHVLFMDGQVKTLEPGIARLRRIGKEVGGMWTPPPRSNFDYIGR